MKSVSEGGLIPDSHGVQLISPGERSPSSLRTPKSKPTSLERREGKKEGTDGRTDGWTEGRGHKFNTQKERLSADEAPGSGLIWNLDAAALQNWANTVGNSELTPSAPLAAEGARPTHGGHW